MITDVRIQGLRGIRTGEVSGITALTVLVGPNGSGKSTVLDVLLIAANREPLEGIDFAVRRTPAAARDSGTLALLERRTRRTGAADCHTR